MKLKELTKILDMQFHKECSLKWDNSGLLIGDFESEIKHILVALDIGSEVIGEAIKSKTNLIFTHHPLIFNPIKNIISNNYPGKEILKLAENKIAVYCAHTNYDMMENGLNDYLAGLLEMENINKIISYSAKWFKFVIFVPLDYEEKVRNAMCFAGGGCWKDYTCCTFNTEGNGTFKPGIDSNPFIGEKGSLSVVKEARIECIIQSEKLEDLIRNVLEAHPYDEPAYDVYPLENKFEEGGIGRIGSIKQAISSDAFLDFIKEKLNIYNFKYIFKSNSSIINKVIKKVAVINGSINSLTAELGSLDFDALICGEVNYHNAQLISENGRLLIELGHAESELFAIGHLFKILTKISDSMSLGLKILKSNNKELLWRYSIGR